MDHPSSSYLLLATYFISETFVRVCATRHYRSIWAVNFNLLIWFLVETKSRQKNYVP